MKKTLLVLFTILSVNTQATVLHWPECLSGTLFVQNKTNDPQKIWIQTFDPTLKSEQNYDLKSQDVFKLAINKKSTKERTALLHFSNAKDINVNFQCQNKIFSATSIEGGIQTFRKSDLLNQTVYLKNLFTEKNNFKVEFLNQFGQPIQSFSYLLNSNEQKKIMLQKNNSVFYIRVAADNKFSAFNLNSTGSQNAMIADVQTTAENNDGIYFEIGPRSGAGDTFVVQIKDLNMIDKARLQISNPNLEKMLFAKIQKGHNFQNRNLASVNKSFWNWSVTEVTNIADLGSTACNGLPQIIDDRIDSWVTDPGRICFWTYRIKREVPALEIATGQKNPF
jgi:hypothetical protein